jgi:hypothetical protein
MNNNNRNNVMSVTRKLTSLFVRHSIEALNERVEENCDANLRTLGTAFLFLGGLLPAFASGINKFMKQA